MKRSFDGDGGDSAPRRSRKGEPSTLPCVLKFLAPEVLASAVIGKGGSVIANMRSAAQARVSLTDHGDFYPGTDCRVLTTSANTADSLMEVSRQIIAKIAECAQSGAADAAGALPSELKLRTLAPKVAAGGIIGKGGQNIQLLREQTGAKISLSEPVASEATQEQIVSIIGAPQALERVMGEVNRQIQAVGNESWFLSWAVTPYAGHSAGHGGGRGGAGGYQALPASGSGPARAPLDFGVPAYGGGAATHGGNRAGVGLLTRVAENLPHYVTEDHRGFALSCTVPNRLVGGLIGRGGSGTKEVQAATSTKIAIRDLPNDPENRQLHIAGPLTHVCAAYMLMMKRYLEVEQTM